MFLYSMLARNSLNNIQMFYLHVNNIFVSLIQMIFFHAMKMFSKL